MLRAVHFNELTLLWTPRKWMVLNACGYILGLMRSSFSDDYQNDYYNNSDLELMLFVVFEKLENSVQFQRCEIEIS